MEPPNPVLEPVEITQTVEWYTNTITDNDRNKFTANGIRASRFIYRSDGRPDILINQYKDSDIYVSTSGLSLWALASRSSLRRAIERVEPPEDQRRLLIDTFSHTWGWDNVASEAARSVTDNYFNGSPVCIVGYEVLWTTNTKSQANQWANQTFHGVGAETVVNADTTCGVCLQNVYHAPIHDIIGFHSCEHVCHKRCIFRKIFDDVRERSCPRCHENYGGFDFYDFYKI